ncbi:MAG: pilin [Patescibacteria group bacterium]
MKKNFGKILLALVLLGGFSLALDSYAVDYGTKATQEATCNDSGKKDCYLPSKVAEVEAGPNAIPELVGSVVQIVLSIIGIVFFLLILYAGFNWMTARGNSEKIDKSKETIESAAIGIIVILAAYAITNFIFSNLQTGNSSQAVCNSGSEAVCANRVTNSSCTTASNTAGSCVDADGSATCVCQ